MGKRIYLREIAILGPTASGKTSLSIDLAKELNANILSLDSLSIYKEIDIASAKPTLKEREGIKHFGIDALHVNENFNVTTFFKLFKEAREQSIKESKNLIIVGGTGFYLKSMIDGVSYKPELSETIKIKVAQHLNDGYKLMKETDETYANNISSSDSYRIEKWLEIYFATNIIPSEFFKQNQKEPVIKDLELYEIEVDKEILKDRISKRTQIMLDDGLIDEVFFLENKYTRAPNPMKAIGIKETLAYFDGELNKTELKERIIINTGKLAKRQRTFNSSQFVSHTKASVKELYKLISSYPS